MSTDIVENIPRRILHGERHQGLATLKLDHTKAFLNSVCVCHTSFSQSGWLQVSRWGEKRREGRFTARKVEVRELIRADFHHESVLVKAPEEEIGSPPMIQFGLAEGIGIGKVRMGLRHSDSRRPGRCLSARISLLVL
jgi:hypothetical protein